MNNIPLIFNVIKEILQMTEKASAWRFIAILITIILIFLIWRLPEILAILLN